MANFEQEQKIDDILNYLAAHDQGIVREALKLYAHYKQGIRQGHGWKLWTDSGLPPRSYEWRELDGRTYYREARNPEILASAAARTMKGTRQVKRADITMRKVDSLRCPRCGGELFKEPVCPGSKEGKAGLRLRLYCGDYPECDYLESI